MVTVSFNEVQRAALNRAIVRDGYGSKGYDRECHYGKGDMEMATSYAFPRLDVIIRMRIEEEEFNNYGGEL